MIYDMDYIVARLDDDVERIDIYENHIMIPGDDRPAFQVIKKGNIHEAIENFRTNCPGKYTFFIRTAEGQSWKNAQRVLVNNQLVNSDPAPVNMQGVTDPESFRASIIAEIRKEDEVNRLKQELAEKDAEIQRIQKPGEKLVYVIENLINRIEAKKQPAALQGDQGSDEQTEAEIMDPEALEAAFSILLKHLGEATILQVAKKIESNPSVVPQIRTFLT